MIQILCFWLIKYKEGYAGIINLGVINVGSRNLYGPGVYATRFNSRFVAFLNGTPLRNSTHKIVINNMGKFVRPYFLFGNSFDDPTNIWERITNSYEGDIDGQACY